MLFYIKTEDKLVVISNVNGAYCFKLTFYLQGSEQLGSRLVNTRKWIGATEVITLLSFLRIRCQLIDFHRPTGPSGTHPELFSWVFRYFENGAESDFVPPLYLQHQGKIVFGRLKAIRSSRRALRF